MKTAQSVLRIGLARVKGEHLHAVNEKNADQRIGLLNPSFKYTPAASSDIRVTFARIRRQQGASK